MTLDDRDAIRALHAKYLAENLNLAQVAVLAGVAANTVRVWFIRLGLPRHTSGAQKGAPSPRRGKLYPGTRPDMRKATNALPA